MPLNAYWGPLVERSEDFADTSFLMEPLAIPEQQFWPEEYSSFGGLHFKETACKINFFDGTRDFRWAPATYELAPDGNTLCLILHDLYYPIDVRLYYRLHTEYDILERWCQICNQGTAVQVERCCSAQFSLPGTGYQCVNFTGRWSGEFQQREVNLSCGKQIFDSLCGVTGHQCSPVFAVHRGANEDHGSIWFGALAYSGNFKIILENICGHMLNILAGISDTDFLWTISEGECFEAPHLYAGYADGFSAMSHLLHRFSLNWLLPAETSHKTLPVLYNSWYATEFGVDDIQQHLLAEKAAALGVELFVVDDGWFKGRTDSSAGLGDWIPDPQKFPCGLSPLIHHVQLLGMRFGLWIEPEMVNPESQLYHLHPDWILQYPNREPLMWRNQYILNLALSPVQDYLFTALHSLLLENDISYLKWDMNRYAAEIGSRNVKPETWRSLWHKQVVGVYELAGKLRSAHPQLEMEACASGGGRVDFSALQYFDEFWPSDNTDPLDRLAIQQHYSLFYPIKCMRSWITDDFAFNGRRVPLRFAAHVAMCGALGIGLDLNQETPERLRSLSQYIEQYKRIRPIIQFGTLYRLNSFENTDTHIIQYVLGNRIVLFAFLQKGHYGRKLYRCCLKGLEPSSLYCFDTGGHHVVKSGAYLMQCGILLNLHGDWDSRIIEFEIS